MINVLTSKQWVIFSCLFKNGRPFHSCHFFCGLVPVTALLFILTSYQIILVFLLCKILWFITPSVFLIQYLVIKIRINNILYMLKSTHTQNKTFCENRNYIFFFYIYIYIYIYSQRIDLSAYNSHTIFIIKWQIIRFILCESQSSVFI